MPLPATRRRPPSSIACRRIRPPSRRLSCPAARSPSPRLPARSACSTTRVSRRPTSPTLPTSSTAPRRPAVPSPFCSTAGRARHRRGCNSATPDRGGCSITGDAAVSSASPDLLPNAETWLDFTDLVFIDPVGTGYSRFVATGDDVRKRFFSVDGDVSSIALVIRRWLEKHDRLLSPKVRRRRKLWRHSRAEDRAQSADPAGRRRARPDPGLAAARLPRLFRLQPSAICRKPADHGGGGARSQGAGDAQRSRRGRTLRARRISHRSPQGPGRHRGHHAARRQVCRPDRHRPGGEPQARRTFRRQRIPPGVRPPQRQGDRTLRCVGRRLRSLSGFKLLPFRRSLRQFPAGALDQRGGRPHHAQAELAAGRLVSIAQRQREPGPGISAAARPSR